MRTHDIAAMAMAAAVFGGITACSENPGEKEVPAFVDSMVPAADNVVIGHDLDVFPSATPQDWVSYASHVSLFTVIDEKERPWGEHERAHREGMVGRDVTVRTDDVLWRGGTAPDVSHEFTAVTDGWALKKGNLTPTAALGGPRLEVGERYLGAWTYSSQKGWAVLSVRAVFPVDDLGRPRRHEWSEPSPVGAMFVGAFPDQISRMLSATKPDPRVAAYAHLEPWARRIALELEQLPDRPGFLKGTREKLFGGQLGYVREKDWDRLQREQDTTSVVSFYDVAGDQYSADEGGGITLEGFVLKG